MQLSEYLMWLGRPVFYYPELAPLVGGVEAAVLLCQLIHWHEESSHPDHEIHKTAADIKAETGLSRDEQRTARRELVKRGVLHERYERLDHRLIFRVDLDALDALGVAAGLVSETNKKMADKHLQACGTVTSMAGGNVCG